MCAQDEHLSPLYPSAHLEDWHKRACRFATAARSMDRSGRSSIRQIPCWTQNLALRPASPLTVVVCSHHSILKMPRNDLISIPVSSVVYTNAETDGELRVFTNQSESWGVGGTGADCQLHLLST